MMLTKGADFCEGSDFHRNVQTEVMQTLERLHQAEEDEVVLTKKINNLGEDKVILTDKINILTAEKTSMMKELVETREVLDQTRLIQESLAEKVDSLERENSLLQGELKEVNDDFEDTEDEILSLKRHKEKLSVKIAQQAKIILILKSSKTTEPGKQEPGHSEIIEMLTQEIASLKRQLADVNLAYSLLSTTVTAQKMHELTSQNLDLEQELADTKDYLETVLNSGLSSTLRHSDTDTDISVDTNDLLQLYSNEEEELNQQSYIKPYRPMSTNDLLQLNFNEEEELNHQSNISPDRPVITSSLLSTEPHEDKVASIDLLESDKVPEDDLYLLGVSTFTSKI